MKAALRIFTAATVARAIIGAGPGLHRGERGHDEQPARNRQPGEIDRRADAGKAGNISAGPRRTTAGGTPHTPMPRSSGKNAEQHRAGERRAEHDAPARDRRGKRRADADRDRKQREIGGGGVFVAADRILDQRRQQRQHDDADEPEPARHHGAPPQPRIGAQMADQRGGRGGDVERHLQMRRALARRRDEQAGDPAGERETHHQRGEDRRFAAARRQPTDDGAGQNRDEGRAFHQRIAGGQLLALEMVRQDAVFDRAEQRRDDAEASERDEQDRHRLPRVAERGKSGDEDLKKLSAIAPRAPCRNGRRIRRRAPRGKNTAR